MLRGTQSNYVIRASRLVTCLRQGTTNTCTNNRIQPKNGFTRDNCERSSSITTTKRCKTTNASGSNTTNKQISNQAPEIKIDVEGNTVLHQKAARAAELHAELNALLDKQAKRRAEEMNRPFGAGFLSFLKKSKSEIINIFAAFTCVLLAWQISNIRKGARRLLDEAGEKELRMEKFKQILRILSNDEFSAKVAKAYEEQLENSKLVEMEKKGKRWFLGGDSTRSRKIIANERGEDENVLLKKVLEDELRKTIGDIALTEYELEEKKLQILQKEMGIMDTVPATKEESKTGYMNNSASSNKTATDESSLGGLESILVDVQNGNDSNSNQKVVKRKGFI